MVRKIITLSRWQKSLVLWLVEIACVPLAYLAARIILTAGPSAAATTALFLHLALLMTAAAVLSLVSDVHRLRLKEYDRVAMTMSAVEAGVLAVLSSAALHFLPLDPAPGFSIVFGLMLFAGWVGSRIAMLHLLQLIYLKSDAVTRVIVYGAGRSGLSLATALRGRSDIVQVAFLDDNVALRGLTLMGIPVHPFIEIERLLAHQKVDRVILAQSALTPEKELWVTRRLTALGLDVQALPAFAQLIGEGDLVAKLERKSVGALIQRETVGRFVDEGLNSYSGEVVMVTGAGGSIGIELCRQVLECRPACLVLFELGEHALYAAEKELSQRADGVRIVAVLGSVADELLVARTLREHRVGVIFHAAAYKHVPMVEENPRAGMANNALGTADLARVARECGVGRFVLVSTDKAVRPANVMGASKRFAELAVQDLAARPSATVFSIVRFGNVLGSSGSVVPRFLEQIERGGPVTLTHPEVRRYFMTIEEAAHLVLVAGSIARGGDVFVLDMGEQIAIGDLARRMIEGAGYTVRDRTRPKGDIEIVVTGLRPGEKLREELTISNSAAPTAHPKILRVAEHHLSELQMAAALRDLREAVEAGDDPALNRAARRWIPECSAPLAAAVPGAPVQVQVPDPAQAKAPMSLHGPGTKRRGH